MLLQLGILLVLVAALVAFSIWAWLIKRRLGAGPPDRPGHEAERFPFKYGGEPPGAV